MSCTHSLADRETLCADGICPNCLVEEKIRLSFYIEELEDDVKRLLGEKSEVMREALQGN